MTWFESGLDLHHALPWLTLPLHLFTLCWTLLLAAMSMPSTQDGQRLIVVSNRLPVTIKKGEDGEWSFSMSSGGLVSALSGCKKQMDFTWIGWPGGCCLSLSSAFCACLLVCLLCSEAEAMVDLVMHDKKQQAGMDYYKTTILTAFVSLYPLLFCLPPFMQPPQPPSSLDYLGAMLSMHALRSLFCTNNCTIHSFSYTSSNPFSYQINHPSSCIIPLSSTGVDVPEAERETVSKRLMEEYSCKPVFVSDEIADRHYNGFSNSILWPLFHYRRSFLSFRFLLFIHEERDLT